ncbi:hypothetical protein METBIDRAFT_46782 [Metschnikowia bicuspidata var. bicuspidata NRRL YB-4993]|uniref:Uncharacterized protein n=1 Tax=Metschnikowia bicuspidata var. bicuspidata NRRL YB-4993 TaxID=869754 RepID=A0A1A0H5I9_9ASCO|nr:hypothetical protein METBIDRAFT_46782 [Metschnikowia bicuspidata var. bicuspidata NRRL YB-4993]OBA19306.1 hypothetical protein METBIDRAFT_46782 [Metschnikowia bicuspidata var. bicuspidata NRRL YB-4993]
MTHSTLWHKSVRFFKMIKRGATLGLLRQYSRYAKNDQIFLHDVAGRYAATLSKNATDVPIGFSPSLEVSPSNFEGNPKFLDLLHDRIKTGIQNDFTFIMEAGTNALTYMPIYDFREIPKYARTPNVDDVFGYVLVDGSGKIVPDSYEKNDLYRICNGTGLIKLSEYLLEEMKKATSA